MIKNIQQISDLSQLLSAISDGKLIVANKQKKSNYYINLEKIKGDKISNITELSGTTKRNKNENLIRLFFDNGLEKRFSVYNGIDGESGIKGSKGDKGDKGLSVTAPNKNDSTFFFYIVNDDNTDNPQLPWSAYRGKILYNFIKSLSETIISDDEYYLLFSEDEDNLAYKTLLVEFTTKADNQDIVIVNNDNSQHKTYIKYWTYEDENLIEYFIKTGENTYERVDYFDGVSFDLWTHYYLNPDNNETYYTRELETYVINERTGETGTRYKYTEIDPKPVWLEVEYTTDQEDEIVNIINNTKELGDDNYVDTDPTEEDISITIIPIEGIFINEFNEYKKNISIEMDVNSIATKNIVINPSNYTTLIDISYDPTYVKVFEDGRIMALENVTGSEGTDVVISSNINPLYKATINIHVVKLIKSLQLGTNENPFTTKYYKSDEVIDLSNYIKIVPEDATNPILHYSVNPNYVERSFDDLFYVNYNNNIIFKNDNDEQSIYVYDNYEYKEIFINNLTNDWQILVEGDIICKNGDDIYPEFYIIDDEEIISITEDGKLSLLNEGTATIVIETTDNSNISTMVDIEVLTKSMDIEINDVDLYTMEIPTTIIDENTHQETEVIQTLENCYNLLLGVIQTISASVYPDNTSYKELEWSVNAQGQEVILDPSEDTLSCRIMLNKYDNYVLTIRTKDGGCEKTINLIPKYPITQLDIVDINDNPIDNIILDNGNTFILKAIINEDASIIQDTNNVNNSVLRWESIDINNINVVSISGNTNYQRTIKAENGGDAKIRISALDGSGIYKEISVASMVNITNIILNNNENITMNNNSTYTITTSITPSDAYNKTLDWYSSNTNIVEVDNNGKITSHNQGKAIIYGIAKDNSGVIASINVNVVVKSNELNIINDNDQYDLSDIVISDYELSLNVNDNYTLIAAVYPDDATCQLLNYSSRNPEIVEIDNNGNITAIQEGQTNIVISTKDTDENGNPLLSKICKVIVN